MQLFQTLTIAALSGTVSAGCFTSGAIWNGRQAHDAAKGAIDDFCNRGELSGYFNPQQEKTRCAPLDGGSHADFKVKWLGNGGLTLKVEDCKLRLKNEVDGCTYGGRTVTADWEFTSDPNAGASC
ncbi:hypothetical protein DER46DRAFT_572134 [Fusarium sp. MPI-SDFR-AT-0072]|nr:hypothetical protein DER46DRAFT_572134 [Fusarium sp. MPI-SDFR-AT-0072]BDU14761.1 hypothetical protein g486 [Fusarium commune]